MKILLFSASLLLLPMAAQATCSLTDFSIKDFKTAARTTGTGTQLSLSGELVNNCSEPAAAQITIEAKDAEGNVIQSKQGWPAGTTNIAPGEAAKFDLGRRFRYQSDMSTYTASIVAVRAW
ncbi:MAG TPA: hypothetical protein VIL60_04330 [Rhodanobacter sp.]